jgi:hypothetical protein
MTLADSDVAYRPLPRALVRLEARLRYPYDSL